jgi:hypothetical protein
MAERDQEKYRAQTEALYAAIGKFAVKFEQMVFLMQSTVITILQLHGLKNQLLATALLADLTADPIRKIFGSVLIEARENDAADKRIVDNILKRVQSLIERRNDVLHRVWFVGWASADQTEFDRVASVRFKNTKSGPEFKQLKYSTEDFDRLSDEAEEIKGLIGRLDGVWCQLNHIRQIFLSTMMEVSGSFRARRRGLDLSPSI